MENPDFPAYHEDEIVELYFPECEDKIKPYVGQIFANLDEAYDFYDNYAAAYGFQIRKSTVISTDDGSIRTRYVLCNREGLPPKPDELLMSKNNSSTQKRKRTSCKADCMARIVFQISNFGRYKVCTFNEGHTHTMIPQVSRHLMMSNRKVDTVHQMFIISGIKANIGPMRAFRMYKEIVGSYEDIGCTDDENKLCRLIWTDEASVKNYKMFGEAVSFDATYNTNRDNHGKCMSFGAAIISREDVESYAWVLEKFVECIGHALLLFITDQDPGLKKAVASVWPQRRHRYCMWHITMKVTEKLPVRLRDNSEFKTNFGKIVWSDLDEPHVFEGNWKNLIDKYDFSDNRWFSDMFDDRSSWIPAYFRDVSMSGLFRTTSLSERENSYFKRFLNKNADLVLLYMNYSSALEAQRHNYKKLTHADETGVPPMLTKLSIERHASTIYTNDIFKEVQVEIDASLLRCMMYKMEEEVDESIYVVHDNVDGKFTARHKLFENYSSCSCKLFTRKGILCRHIFLAFHTLQVSKFSDKYISKRWCKFSRLSSTDSVIQLDNTQGQNPELGNNHFFKVLSNCLGHVHGNEELREQLLTTLIEVENRFSKIGNRESNHQAKQRLFQEFYGSAPPNTPAVLPPPYPKLKAVALVEEENPTMKKLWLLHRSQCEIAKNVIPWDTTILGIVQQISFQTDVNSIALFS